MRRWWRSLLLVPVLALTGCFGGGGGGGTNSASRPPPPSGFQSYGNAKIAVKTVDKGTYNRTFVLRVRDRKTGVPVCGAHVTVYGQMLSPHLMTLIERALHPMKCGTYEGDYTFIMPGEWTANFVLRTKQGEASTAALPLKIGS